MIGRLNAYLFYCRLACNLLPLVAFATAELIRFGGYFVYSSTEYDPVGYMRLLLVVTVVWSVVADHYELAGSNEIFVERSGIRRVVSACSVTYMALFMALFFYRDLSVSRIFLTVSAATLFLSAVAMRYLVRHILLQKTSGRNAARLLIIGSDGHAACVAERLLGLQNPACRVIGYVQLPGQEISVAGAPVHRLEELDELAVGNRMDDIIVSVPAARFQQISEIMPTLDRLSAPVRVVLDLGPGVAIRDRIFHFGAINLLDLTSTPLDTIHYFLFKRAVDIVLALFFLCLTAPAMLAVAIAVRLSSAGPIFFVQDRVGLNGKVFRMYKFRTMRVSSARESDTQWTVAQDGRRTRLGSFLRRTSLDELPQFLNVLRGDMSVVGPRPERPHFVRKFLNDVARYNNRHRLKVGMTGWAQVNGLRGDTSIRERVDHDLYYLQNWSLALDLRIILMTIWTGIFGRNAY